MDDANQAVSRPSLDRDLERPGAVGVEERAHATCPRIAATEALTPTTTLRRATVADHVRAQIERL